MLKLLITVLLLATGCPVLAEVANKVIPHYLVRRANIPVAPKNISYSELENIYGKSMDALPTEDRYTVIPTTHKKFKYAQQILADTKLGLKQLYPNSAEKIKYVPLILVDSKDDIEAEALMYPQNNENFPFIAMGINFFDDDVPKELTVGILAHELTHIMLGDSGSDDDSPFSYYIRTKENIGLPHFMPSGIDVDTMAVISYWMDIANTVGAFTSVNSPFQEDFGNTIHNAMFYSVIPWLEKNCGIKVPQAKDIPGNVGRVSMVFGRFNNGSEEQRKQRHDRIMLDVRRCFSRIPKDQHLTFNKIEEQLNYSEGYFSRLYTQATDQQLTDLNVTDALIEISKSLVKQRISLESLIDFSAIRSYTLEDRADEVAMTLINHLGLPLEPYMASALKFKGLENDPLEIKACYEMVEKNQEPPFGTLLDDHHSGCWRYWHLKQFISQFKKLPGLE